jgi:hypothetical protein
VVGEEFLYDMVHDSVKVASRFVQNDDLCFAENGATDAN